MVFINDIERLLKKAIVAAAPNISMYSHGIRQKHVP